MTFRVLLAWGPFHAMVYAIFNLLIVYGNIQTEHFKYYEPLKSWESLGLMD